METVDNLVAVRDPRADRLLEPVRAVRGGRRADFTAEVRRQVLAGREERIAESKREAIEAIERRAAETVMVLSRSGGKTVTRSRSIAISRKSDRMVSRKDGGATLRKSEATVSSKDNAAVSNKDAIAVLPKNNVKIQNKDSIKISVKNDAGATVSLKYDIKAPGKKDAVVTDKNAIKSAVKDNVNVSRKGDIDIKVSCMDDAAAVAKKEHVTVTRKGHTDVSRKDVVPVTIEEHATVSREYVESVSSEYHTTVSRNDNAVVSDKGDVAAVSPHDDVRVSFDDDVAVSPNDVVAPSFNDDIVTVSYNDNASVSGNDDGAAVAVGKNTRRELSASDVGGAGKLNMPGKQYNKIHAQQREATKSENRAAFRRSALAPVEGIALDVRNNQASDIATQALSKISAMLDLPSDKAFDTQSLISFDQDSLEQFADILMTLERIGALLDYAATSGETLDVSGVTITPEDAAMLSADLRIEKFHLQMSLSHIGAREIVSDIMTEKSEEFIATGISQATDPDDLGMSALDTARVFSGLVEGDLAAAIERIGQAKTVETAAIPAPAVQKEISVSDSETMREIFKGAARGVKPDALDIDAAHGKVIPKVEVVTDDVEVPISISELATDKQSGDKSGAGRFSDKNAQHPAAGQAQQVAAALTGESETPNAAVSFEAAQAKATAAVESAEKATSAFSRFENEAVIRQIMEKMQNVIRSGQGAHEIRMILRPEALGEVRMSIRVHGDTVIAKMVVENSQVKAIVESNMQSLKDSLESQNLHAESLSVDVRSDNDGSKQTNRGEMMEALRVDRFGRDGSGDDLDEGELAGVPAGSDTGRRFGSNTFEYFV